MPWLSVRAVLRACHSCLHAVRGWIRRRTTLRVFHASLYVVLGWTHLHEGIVLTCYLLLGLTVLMELERCESHH